MKLFELFAPSAAACGTSMPGIMDYAPDGHSAEVMPGMYDVARGGFDDMIDTEGFWLQNPLEGGGAYGQERAMSLRYMLGEGVEDKGKLKAFFVLGAGGSGKGTVSKDMLSGRGLKYINQDTHLERLLTQAGIPLDKAGSDFGIFKHAQKLARKERDAYAQQRLGLHIEVTGWDYVRIAKPVHMLRKLGYDVYAIIVTTKYETALGRNKKRADAGGRLVPKWSISKAVTGLQQNIPSYVKLFGKAHTVIIDNDKPQDPQHWKNVVAPVLTRAGDKLLNRPVKNKIGRQWVADQRAAKQTATESRPTLVMPQVLLETLR